MSFFGVTVEKIEKVWNHPNADRLDLAKLEGMSFQFVVGKDSWKAGDTCLYFPVDSIVPDELMVKLGLAEKDDDGNIINRKLSGPNKHRVKTIRLRKEISQGLIGPMALIDEYQPSAMVDDLDPTLGITEFLGVKKYEIPTVVEQNANLTALPFGLTRYDIEGADRFPDVIESLMDEPVVVMEKLEGMNFSVFVHRDGTHYVNQRNFTITEKDGKEHAFWKISRNMGLFDKAESILKSLDCERVGIYGEYIGPGVQKNIYKLTEPNVFIYDIKSDGLFANWGDFCSYTTEFDIPIVPLITPENNHPMNEDFKTLREVLGSKTVQEFSDGVSSLTKTAREGVVIKPLVEQYSEELGGRLIIKQRGPKYLSKTDN